MSRELVKARWYEVRSAQNRKPVTYACPFCRDRLPAFSEHVLIRPEGRGENRRHAHFGCALKARRAGRLPSEAEWRAKRVRRRGPLTWLLNRARRWRA